MNFADFATPHTGASWLDMTEPASTESIWSNSGFPDIREGHPHAINAAGNINNAGKSISDIRFQGAWGSKDVAAVMGTSNAAIIPTAEELENATAPGPRMAYEQMHTDDPAHPSFNVSRYYCAISEKYNCPVVGCG